MATFDLARYGPTFADLLQVDRLRPLDAGSPDATCRLKLESLSVWEAFAHVAIRDEEMAGCCWAGAWLLYDFLNESHTISQGISTESGSFWHGIMHRREGDFSNAKYWFRRVDDHPVYGLLADAVREIGEEHLISSDGWDSFAFVDACQSAVRNGDSDAASCQRVQQLEWELLFDHCYSAAVRDSGI